jgi:hypothetical protein
MPTEEMECSLYKASPRPTSTRQKDEMVARVIRGRTPPMIYRAAGEGGSRRVLHTGKRRKAFIPTGFIVHIGRHYLPPLTRLVAERDDARGHGDAPRCFFTPLAAAFIFCFAARRADTGAKVGLKGAHTLLARSFVWCV